MTTKRTYFGVRLNAEERQQLERLARRLRRSRGDTLRWLVAQASEELEEKRRGAGERGSRGPLTTDH